MNNNVCNVGLQRYRIRSPSPCYGCYGYGNYYRYPSQGQANTFTDQQSSLSRAICKQIEYYFSVDNLVKDIFLKTRMDMDGWVSIHLISTFPRVKAMTSDIKLILKALQLSKVIEVNGDKIRKHEDWNKWILPSLIISKEENDIGHDNGIEVEAVTTE